MKTGYVWKARGLDGIFFVLSYAPTMVSAFLTDAKTVDDAIGELSRKHAGYFRRAGPDTRAWGETLVSKRDTVMLV